MLILTVGCVEQVTPKDIATRICIFLEEYLTEILVDHSFQEQILKEYYFSQHNIV